MLRPVHALRTLLVAVAFLSACYGTEEPAPAALPRIAPDVTALLERGQPVDVLVAFDASTGARLDRVAPGAWSMIEAFGSVPIVRVRLESSAALQSFVDCAEVERVETDAIMHIDSAEGLELIGQPTSHAAGFDGAGGTVAVLDTGVDYRHADLGACTAAGAPGCPVVYAADIAPDDGEPDAHGHGTNVAAIVRAVAPAAHIVALDVAVGRDISTSDLIRAIDWVVEHRAAYDIVAINMSLGGGAYDAPCGGSAIATALGVARSSGITPVASSGNDGFTGSMGSPACAPAAVSVGAVYAANFGGVGYPACEDATTQADQITCFTNVATFLSILAPGVFVEAGGHTMTGTSQAAPHVAGAIAVLANAYPGEGPNQWVGRLRGTGHMVRDDRTDRSYARLDLAAATADARTEPPPPPPPPPPAPTDTTAPTGGTAWAWRDPGTISLEWLDFSDAESGIARYRVVFSTDRVPASCSAGDVVYDGAGTQWVHTGLANGVKHYYLVCAIDRAGNVSSGAATAAIPGAAREVPGPNGERLRIPG